MIFKSGRKVFPLTSLLDIILLVLFAQMILTSQLTQKNANEKIEKIRSDIQEEAAKELEKVNSEKEKNEEEIKRLTEEYKDLKDNFDEYFNKAEEEKKSLKNDLEKSNKKISDLETEIEINNKNRIALETDLKELQNEKIKIASESQMLKSEIGDLKNEMENDIEIKMHYETQIEELTNYVKQYNIEDKSKDVSVKKILTSAKALDELKSFITVIEADLNSDSIILKLYDKEESIKWPLDDELKNLSSKVIDEKSSEVREKLKILFDRNRLSKDKAKILLIPTLDTKIINRLQRIFIKELLDRDKIKDYNFIQQINVPTQWVEFNKEN